MASSAEEVPEAFALARYAYDLPSECIAAHPLPRREEARLLHVPSGTGAAPGFRDLHVPDLLELLDPRDLLVTNDTRVLPARLFGSRVSTGGGVEVLVLDASDPASVLALVKTRGRPEVGERLRLPEDESVANPLRLTLSESLGEGRWRLAFDGDPAALEAQMARFGEPPLPPYVLKARGEKRARREDHERYQTLFAQRGGAAAAPTAGLHFGEELLGRLDASGIARASVTLHVGLGTFQPMTAPDVREHRMHSEAVELPPETARAIAAAKARGGRVVAVGTTVMRVLESAPGPAGRPEAFAGETRLCIAPGHRFRQVDRLWTNFHAPHSSLLLLVAAFAGQERMRLAYEHAIERGYRFLSYGDASFLEPAPGVLA